MIWWKTYDLGVNTWSRWRIGPLELFARAIRGEWVFAWRRDENYVAENIEVELDSSREPDRDEYEFSRYTVAFEKAVLNLSPVVADRPFVVRPELPVFLPRGERTTLFVTTPVWVSGSQAHDTPTELFETPTYRASDTWFGLDTIEGELCYATRTLARTERESITRYPHRAITALEITNAGDDTLAIDQLRVPLPALSLYQTKDGRLWTDTVRLVREEDATSAAMTVADNRRKSDSEWIRLRDPRSPVEAGTIISAFSRFLS